MAAALRSIHQTPGLFMKGGSLIRPGRIVVSVRGIRMKEFKEQNVMNPNKPWPYETKKYRWYHSVFNLDVTWNRMDENSKVIVVEGNVGVGKSTLAKGIAELLGMKYYPEANFDAYSEILYGVDMRKIPNERLGPTAKKFHVDDFYKDPFHPLVATFQVDKYVARYFQYLDALNHLFQTGQGVVLERSPHSDFVFMEAMMENGYMSRLARKFYYEMKANTIQDLFRPHAIIYLDAPVDTCLERIKKRNIDYEVNSNVLTPEYLKKLETGYKDEFLPQLEQFSQVIVYDWSTFGDAEAVVEDLEKVPFEIHRYYFDPMFRDWSEFYLKSDWDEARMKYSRWTDWAPEHIHVVESHGANELWISADDHYDLDEVLDEYLDKGRPYHLAADSPFLDKLKVYAGIPLRKIPRAHKIAETF